MRFLDIPKFDLDILEIGMQKFQRESYKAGDFLVQERGISDKLFITEKSITRNFLQLEDGTEKTIWIEPEMKFITDFESYQSLQPSSYNIQLYEDSEVLHISKSDLVELDETYHDWALFGLRLLEEYLFYSFRITSLFLFNDAKENYRLIENEYPRYLQVVPLKHIASRLGISPVTISRIRSERFKEEGERE